MKQKLAVWLSVLMWLATTAARADEAPAPPPGPPGKPGAEHVPEAAAEEAEKDWSVTAGYDFFNIYLYRGVDLLDDDPVHVPYVIGTYQGFSAYFYGYYGDSDEGDTWYEENDWGADYTHWFFDEKLSVTGGFVFYIYPDSVSANDTVELYGSVGLDVLFQPTVTLNWDIDELRTGYLTIGISHSFDVGSQLGLPEPMTLTIDPSAALGIDLGYNSRYYGTGAREDFNDILLGVDVPWNLSENFCVHALVQLSIALDAVRKLTEFNQGNEWVFGVGASLAF